jgi:hypothetical protein
VAAIAFVSAQLDDLAEGGYVQILSNASELWQLTTFNKVKVCRPENNSIEKSEKSQDVDFLTTKWLQ